MNSLGYAEAYSRDLDSREKNLRRTYGRQPNQKTNSLDSLGEAYFLNGYFAGGRKRFHGRP